MKREIAERGWRIENRKLDLRYIAMWRSNHFENR